MFSDDFINKIGFEHDRVNISPFINEEDGEEYEVWKIESEDEIFVLKKEKGREAAIYETYLSVFDEHVPKLCKIFEHEGTKYMLTDYFSGTTLLRCGRDEIKSALDALMNIQNKFWGFPADKYYEDSLSSRKSRGDYLCDATIEKAYAKFLKRYAEMPKTLCHDDLLPFNVLSNGEKAVIIDWECAGIIPYLSSFARFIAHVSSEKDAFFFMEDGDKEFAVDYYYTKFIKEKGIGYNDFLDDLELFLLYEYCEWVMIGNKYDDAKGDRFYHYLNLAKQQAEKINNK